MFNLRGQKAFTLIELLVVILIIAILVAIAAPSFLNQQDKAHDSATKQSLTVVRKELKAIYVSDGNQIAHPPLGSMPNPASGTLLAQLQASEPQYTFVEEEQTPTSSTLAENLASTQQISVTRDSDSRVTACQQSRSGLVFCLTADETSGLEQLTASNKSLFNAETAYAAGKTDVVYTIGTGATLADAEFAARCVAQKAVPGVTQSCPSTGQVGWSQPKGSVQVPVPVVNAPVNNDLPTISGEAVKGRVPTANNGNWSYVENATYEYQWYRDQTLIPNADSATYTPVAADVGKKLSVRVTAKNNGVSVPAQSNETSTVLSPPENTAAPFITGTATSEGSLTGHSGDWTADGDITYSYTWILCGASGEPCQTSGNTGTTLSLTPGWVGQSARFRVTATANGVSTTVTSDYTPVTMAAPSNTSLPTISGSTALGSTLTADAGTWNGQPSLAYQWQVCDTTCGDIAGANSSSLTTGSGQIGKKIRIVVTATNSGGQSTAASAQTAAVTLLADAGNRLSDGVASSNVPIYLAASYFNDNNDSTEFVKNGAMSVGDTMTLTFPNQKAIGRVRFLHNYNNGNGNGTPCLTNNPTVNGGTYDGSAVFEISSNGTDWTTATNFDNPSCSSNGVVAQDVTFTSAHAARYARLRVIKARATYWLGIQTFNVYGNTL